MLSAIANRTTLVDSVGAIVRVIEKTNTIPILGHMLIKAGPDGLTFTATDLDIVATAKMGAAVSGNGSLTAPGHLLFDILRKLPKQADVAISESEPGLLAIKAGKSRFALQTLAVLDFPSSNLDQETRYTHQFSISGSGLARMLGDTAFTASHEDTRHYLNGVHLHSMPKGNEQLLRWVATDGHRMARLEMLAPDRMADMPPIIIPNKAVSYVLRLAGDCETVHVSLSQGVIKFDFGATAITSKLIDGTFPDYERVIPAGNDHRCTVAKGALIAAVGRVAAMASRNSRRISLSFSQGTLNLCCKDPDSGAAEEAIDADYEGDPAEIFFNADYLLSIADHVQGEQIIFAFPGPEAAGVIHGPARPDDLFVLMSLRR